MKAVAFREQIQRDVALAFLSSNLFALYYFVWSSCQVINSIDFDIPINLDSLTHDCGGTISNLVKCLIEADRYVEAEQWIRKGIQATKAGLPRIAHQLHDIMRGKHPPHLILRAHFHRLWPETVRIRINTALLAFLAALERGSVTIPNDISLDTVTVHDADIVLLPSYCGMGEYGRKATGSASTLSNGLVAAEIIDGGLHHVHYIEREVDLRREETL